MTDRDIDVFHLNRQMFLLSAEGQVWVHPGPTRDDHRTWAARIGLDWGQVRGEVRGFYWPDSDSVYVYSDGPLDAAVALFLAWAEKIRLALQLHPRTRVFAGMREGEPGTLWTPIHDLGTFGELRPPEPARRRGRR